MATSVINPTERQIRVLITQFCKQNFTFTKSMRIIGSIHVVVDNNEVLSCLLNESHDISDNTVNKLASLTSERPNVDQPSPAGVKALKTTSKDPKQSSSKKKKALKTECVVETISASSSSNNQLTTSSSAPVTSLNKRKRFVPRAYQDPEPASVAVTTISATESVEKSQDEFDQNDYSIAYDNLQESMTEEFQMAVDDATAVDQETTEFIKPTNTPSAKNRLVRFSDMTNAAVVKTESEMSTTKMMKNEYLEETGEMCEEGEMNESKWANSSMRKSMGEPGEFECAPCAKKFKYYCYYKRHLDARHSEEPKFVCEFCSKAYKWEASFRHHLRTHTNESSREAVVAENKENSLLPAQSG